MGQLESHLCQLLQKWAVTGEPADCSHNGNEKSAKRKATPEKNPAAVALGRLGGSEGREGQGSQAISY